jgi:microcompartment protein CcmL/EutN
MSHDGGSAPKPPGPALSMIEISDVPAGFAALDALAKEAEVEILGAGTVQSGHFLVSFAGEVEPVERSFARAMERAGAAVLDAVLLHHAEPRIATALRDGSARQLPQGDALGVLQTATSPTLLRALDAALKGADVDLVELRVADGLGGRGLATLWGKQPDMEAAVEQAEGAFARGVRQGCSAVMIANADPLVARAVASGTRFFKEHRG